MGPVLLGCGAGFVLLLIIGAIANLAGPVDDDQAESKPASSNTTTTVETPTTPAVPTAPPALAFDGARCQPASEALVASISALLVAEGTTLEKVYVVDAGGGRSYLAADMRRADGMVDSAEVWLLEAGVPYALSSDARSGSLAPDGRALPGSPSAGDEVAVYAIDCVTKLP